MRRRERPADPPARSMTSLPADLGLAAARARTAADDVLFPQAQVTDRASLVPRRNLDALRDARLFGLQGPREVPGGLGADHAGARGVLEAVAGGCGATSFVWAQHHGAVRRVVGGDGPARDRWLPRLCDGSTLAGIGFAYLRRPGPPMVRATRTPRGWRIDGEAPWMTGWGLIDALVVMARVDDGSPDDGSVVTVVVDRTSDDRRLHAGKPQALAVMASTGTVTLAFDALEVAERDVVGVQTDDVWRRRDRLGSAMPPPAPLGIADRAIRLLAERAPGPGVAEAAEALGDELQERRDAADRVSASIAAVMAVDAAEETDAVVAAGAAERDRGLDLARRATDALVAAVGGGAMSLEHPAQRLSREATFFLIQAQTGDLRAASLARLSQTRD
jgi:alkylation response protein AidB-like acyl-CoA dehydrogenase